MSRELPQGANITLSDDRIRIGIGWEPERPGNQELDVSAFLLGAEERVGSDDDFVFYNNPTSACGSLQLSQGAIPDRQQFSLHLGSVPARIEKIALCLTLFGGDSLARVQRLHIRILDGAGNEYVIFKPATGGMTEAALILGEVYRRQQQWKFRAVGQGFAGGLGPLARHFGVDIADDNSAEQTAPPAVPPSTASSAPASPAHFAGVLSLTKAPATGVLPTASEPQHSSVANLNYEILYRGAYALARVDLPQGRRLTAQSDAMVAMSPSVDVAGTMQGGLLGGLGRLVSGESLFVQTLAAERAAGAVYLAPASPGDIAAVELNNEGLIIQRSGFLACSEDVQVNTQLQNLAQGLFSGEGFFILKAQGTGLILLESYGAIHRFDLQPGEQKVIDNGHLVAWSQTMDYRLESANVGIVAAFTSGENIVCRFTGPGTVFLQTRNPQQFGLWMNRFLSGN